MTSQLFKVFSFCLILFSSLGSSHACRVFHQPASFQFDWRAVEPAIQYADYLLEYGNRREPRRSPFDYTIWENFIRGVQDREPRLKYYFFLLRYPNLRGKKNAGKRLMKIARDKLHSIYRKKIRDPAFEPSENDFLLLGDAFHWLGHHLEGHMNFTVALEAHQFSAAFYAGTKNRETAASNKLDGLLHAFDHIERIREDLSNMSQHTTATLTYLRQTIAPLLKAREKNAERAHNALGTLKDVDFIFIENF